MAASIGLMIGPVIFGNTEDQIDFLKSKSLLAKSASCISCGTIMEWKKRANINDGYTWRCTNSNCRKMLSIRHKSFFEKSKLSLKTWLQLLQAWSSEDPVTGIKENIDVSERVAIDAYHFLRDICSWKLLQSPIELGGPGKTVQIDESLFKHKPKYHRGTGPQTEKWVFGIVDTSYQPALGYMELVDQRDASTLLPIIMAHVLPGTTIHSDEWRAYSSLASHGFTHSTVNHSLNFVDPISGTHTQHVESYWSRAKRKLRRMHGTSDKLLPSYLDEFMWRECHGKTHSDAFHNICQCISERYPLP